METIINSLICGFIGGILYGAIRDLLKWLRS